MKHTHIKLAFLMLLTAAGLAAESVYSSQITPPSAEGAGTASCADADMNPHHKAFFKSLDLTDAQKTQIRDILRAEWKQVRALDDNATKGQIMAIMKSGRQKIRALLTPEQITRLDQMRSNVEAARHAHSMHASAGTPGEPAPKS